MIIITNKGLSNTSKRIVDLISVRKQPFCFMDLRVCYRDKKRCFSDSSNKIGNQMNSIKVCYNKINNLKDFITKWIVEMYQFFNRLLDKITVLIFMLLYRLIKRIRKCLIGAYRWLNRRIRNLFLSMRRISKSRVPLCYVLIVNIFSIVGCFYICMFIFLDIYMQKLELEAVETIINTIQNQEWNVNNKPYPDDNIFIDKVDYISHTHETDFIHPIVIVCITVFIIKLWTNR